MPEQIDLASLDTVAGANKGFDVKIYHPGTLADLGIVITVFGKDSEEHQKVTRRQNKKRLDRLTKGGFRGMANLPPEETERDGIELLAACTKSWRTGEEPTILLRGENLTCTPQNAAMVYEDFPWLKDQVDTAIGDRANFLGL
jgi:hypothetical protein